MEYIYKYIEKRVKLLKWNARQRYVNFYANSQKIVLCYQIANFEIFMNVTEEMEFKQKIPSSTVYHNYFPRFIIILL